MNLPNKLTMLRVILVPVFMVFAAFVMVGTVNAVNLTDGIDGLATGVTIPVAIFYMAVAAWKSVS